VRNLSLATSLTFSAGAGSAKDFSVATSVAAVCGEVIFRDFTSSDRESNWTLSDIREKSSLPPATFG
jgi:hypothetical protein